MEETHTFQAGQLFVKQHSPCARYKICVKFFYLQLNILEQ